MFGETTRLMRQRALAAIGLSFLLAALLGAGPREALAEQDSGHGSGVGTIVGRVAIDDGMEGSDPPRAVLMSPDWTLVWNRDVQQGLDVYFNRYRDVVARNRDAYSEIAGRAYRDATRSVITEMQRSLGEEFPKWVREVSRDGRFEFTGVPLGDYRVIVLAVVEGRALIWTEALSLSGPIPQFIEVQNVIQ